MQIIIKVNEFLQELKIIQRNRRRNDFVGCRTNVNWAEDDDINYGIS